VARESMGSPHVHAILAASMFAFLTRGQKPCPKPHPGTKENLLVRKSRSVPGTSRPSNRLANEGNLRDLALFSMGIDTMLRGDDLLGLKVEDVTDHTGEVVEQCTIGQQKTGKSTVVALLPYRGSPSKVLMFCSNFEPP